MCRPAGGASPTEGGGARSRSNREDGSPRISQSGNDTAFSQQQLRGGSCNVLVGLHVFHLSAELCVKVEDQRGFL